MKIYPLVQFKDLESTKRVLLRLDFCCYSLPVVPHFEFVDALVKAGKQVVILASGDNVLVEKQLQRLEKYHHQTFLAFDCKKSLSFDKIVEQILAENNQKLFVIYGLDDYGPEKNFKDDFAKQLALLADAYVIDSLNAYGKITSSLSILPLYLPTFYGPSTADDWQNLQLLKKNLFSKRSTFVLGGLFDFSKLDTLKELLPKIDYLLMGTVWTSYFWDKKTGDFDFKEMAEFSKVLKRYASKVIYPLDFLVARYDASSGRYDLRFAKANEVDKKDALVDLGPETIRYYALLMKESDQVIYDDLLSPYTKKPGHADMILARAFANRSRGKALGLATGRPLLDLLLKENLNEFIDVIVPDAIGVYKFLKNKK
jgi:hypothetical protein